MHRPIPGIAALLLAALAGFTTLASAASAASAGGAGQKFRVEEATLFDIQSALLEGRVTTVGLVEQFLGRIRAYNGTCVKQPAGELGPVTTIARAGQINALSTVNLRPAVRKRWGFDARKARSLTDPVDADASMPDALEVAAAQDARFAANGRLVGPLHGMVIAIKDQFDTRDLRTTSGADAPYANDRPPRDSTFVTRLRDAGAIVIGKANMGEYAGGDRSSFGGVFCNPYDTERSPGRSSGGSASAVAANFAVCAIGEESGPSIRNPAKNNNVVGLAGTQELVSRAGMIPASFLNDRVGPMCRTVADAARVLDVIAGYDTQDALTAFAVGRLPAQPYASFAIPRRLEGLRIGVVREYMDVNLFGPADAQTIGIIEREVDVLRQLGATIVDPGPGGALFAPCVRRLAPAVLNSGFIAQYPRLFPAGTDHVPLLVAMAQRPELAPDALSLRGIGGERSVGESRFVLEAYLAARGDANIRTVEDLVEKSTFYTDVREGSGFSDKKRNLQQRVAEKTVDLAGRVQLRFALQQIALQCMAEQQLDALTYPTGNVPAPKLGAPVEPTVHGRSPLAWTLLGAQGFPVISVPAGFATEVYDRVPDLAAPGGTRLVGPVPAKLPVNIDFLGRPFTEPLLLGIAAAYEAASRHREPPAGFGIPVR
jgi:Asp-tRNA(Asn)/Glu-tRNA(Gln) amidotransferase A subunit family amidase